MICEREMSLAGDGKQLKNVMIECPMVENSKERKQLQETSAARQLTDEKTEREVTVKTMTVVDDVPAGLQRESADSGAVERGREALGPRSLSPRELTPIDRFSRFCVHRYKVCTTSL